MGITPALCGKKVYLDANVFIYWLEDVPVFAPLVEPLFRWLGAGEMQALTSELTLAEVLTKPFQDEAPARQRVYETALQTQAR